MKFKEAVSNLEKMTEATKQSTITNKDNEIETVVESIEALIKYYHITSKFLEDIAKKVGV